MYEFEWAKKDLWQRAAQPEKSASTSLDSTQVESTELLHWREHCLECALPECYKACPLYAPRPDQKCARFAYGIYPNPNLTGLLDCGADIQFRRWAKLETTLFGTMLDVRWHRRLHQLDKYASRIVNFLSEILARVSPRRRLNGALTYFRNILFRNLSFGREHGPYDAFVLECYSL